MVPGMTGDVVLDELITYYDDATGERAGLTASELGEWSAATAALLTEGCGLRPGSRVGVLLPPHWQTAAVLLGAWSAGMEVSFRGWATAGLSPAGEPLDATFVHLRRVGNWLDDVPAGGHQFVLGLAPGSAAVAEVPAGYDDYPSSVRPYFGSAPPSSTVSVHDTAATGVTFGEYEAIVRTVAESRGIGRGDRVLVDASSAEDPMFWLMAPLSVGASIVLCANLDHAKLDERTAAERVTQVFSTGSSAPGPSAADVAVPAVR
jgi:uncharacterized protein (TIGR03089 family)